MEGIEVIGAFRSPQPSAITATTGGPGGGGRIAIRTGYLTVQNGSQIAANLGGGGSGGTIDIVAARSVEVSGQSANDISQSHFRQSDLNGGEFGVLRSIRTNSQLPQNIEMLLDTQIVVFTGTPGSIRSMPRNGETGSNAITINGFIDPISSPIFATQITGDTGSAQLKHHSRCRRSVRWSPIGRTVIFA